MDEEYEILEVSIETVYINDNEASHFRNPGRAHDL